MNARPPHAAIAALLLLYACHDDSADRPADPPLDAGVPLDAAPRWTVNPAPIYAGQYGAIGDPSIVRDASGTFWLYHMCLDVERRPQGAELCLATSRDGLAWTSVATPHATPLVLGRLLRSPAGAWDEAHETPFARRAGEVTSLYFTGYRGAGFTVSPPAQLGLTTSRDGVAFAAVAATPMLAASPTGPDAYGMTSPSVVALDDGSLVLYYTAWCGPPFACPHPADAFRLSLVAATSRDGRTWTRHSEILVGDPGLAWTNGGISETEVVRGPDRRFYLFFTSLSGRAGAPYAAQRIGVAVASSPLGPFTFTPTPIVEPEPLGAWANGGVVAPTVQFDGPRIRLWFHAFEHDASGAPKASRIGYAEAVPAP